MYFKVELRGWSGNKKLTVCCLGLGSLATKYFELHLYTELVISTMIGLRDHVLDSTM